MSIRKEARRLIANLLPGAFRELIQPKLESLRYKVAVTEAGMVFAWRVSK